MSVWQNIPLEDYEGHMLAPSVRQLDMLADILFEQVEKYTPESISIWGVAGGNGLDKIISTSVKRVVGLDINEDYLQICKDRHATRFDSLELCCCNLNSENLPVYCVEFIWAALILEYVDLGKAVRYATNCLKKDGIISILIQKDNGLKSVESSFESINKIKEVFRSVDEDMIERQIDSDLFRIVSKREYLLESGKSFVVLDLEKK